MRNLKKRVSIPVILSSIILFQLINNYIWLRLDNTYLILDSHEHFLFSLNVFNGIMGLPVRWHGIFAGYLTAPFYFISGVSQDAGVMINSSIFLTVLVLSTYGLAKIIAGRKAGLLSAFIVTMYPLIFNHLRIYMLDLPLAALVALSIFLLLKTGGFSSKTYSLLFALSISAGLLTKFNFLGFIIGPLVLELSRGFKINNRLKKRLLLRLLILLSLILILIFWFYKIKVWHIFARFYECSWLYPAYGLSFQSISGWIITGFQFITWCLKELANNIMSFFFFIMFALGTVVFIRNEFNYKKILWLWIITPLFLLSLVFHYPAVDRYLMPLLPALAIITGIGITGIRQPAVRRITVGLIILFGLWQFFCISYNLSFLPKRLRSWSPADFNLVRRDIQIPYRSDRDHFSYPKNIPFPAEEILKVITRDSQGLKYKPYVFFTDIVPEISAPLAYLNAKNNYPFYLLNIPIDTEEYYRYRSESWISPNLADYVIISNKLPFSSELITRQINNISRKSKNFIKKYNHRYSVLKKFSLPSGNSLVLLKNTGRHRELEGPALKACFRDGLLRLYSQSSTPAKPDIFGSAFSFKGKEYYSVEAEWKIENSGQDEIAATAKYPDIPIEEKWRIYIKDNRIELKISLTTAEQIEIENSNLFFAFFDNYTGWKSGEKQGKFSRQNIAIFTDILLAKETGYISFQGQHKNSIAVSLSSVNNNSRVIPKISRNNSRVILRLFWENAKGNKLVLSRKEQNVLQLKVIPGE
ncbi:MAG: glycosyltransferase family 39 protein [Candidatus Omnitrophica bacterium]|nr:glycosyltransferase family 39 protein [Candidatus Omnitrophota bacterium]MDD5662239.1 glycosyltransferase family 39 protein [Candidatus Omnitrophota bacterium]